MDDVDWQFIAAARATKARLAARDKPGHQNQRLVAPDLQHDTEATDEDKQTAHWRTLARAVHPAAEALLRHAR